MQKTYKSNPGIAGELYHPIKSYMVTNIGNDQFLKLMDLGRKMVLQRIGHCREREEKARF